MRSLSSCWISAAILAIALACEPVSTDSQAGSVERPGQPEVQQPDDPDPGVPQDPQIEFVITTSPAGSIDVSSALLSASYAGAADPVREVGFEWGAEEDEQGEYLQAEVADYSASAGVFSATLTGLGAGHTYWFRAYVILHREGKFQRFFGQALEFATLPQTDTPTPDPPPTPPDPPSGSGNAIGWYELPAMHLQKSGSYYINASDNTQYYAWHLCAGGETGPGGKTARNYTVCYSSEHHCPVWVAAPRHSMYVGSSGRNDSYRQDPDIPADIQYSAKTTSGSGCNKGHMLGSAERTCSKATNRDVFYYPNIAPQLSTGFNTGGGGWNTLEDWVDGQVCADTLYEVIGCYFKAFSHTYKKQNSTFEVSQSPQTISYCGRTDVHMPTMFYYVLLRTKKGNSGKALKDCQASEMKCAAFVRTHSNDLKGVPVTSYDMMSVSDLETLTGETFFPNVPNAPKGTATASDWGL